MDLINRYENLKFRLEALGKDLKQYEDRVKRNREIEEERSANERRRGDFAKKISVLEEETKQYGLLGDIEKRLAALLKVRGKSKSKDAGKDSKTNEQYKIE